VTSDNFIYLEKPYKKSITEYYCSALGWLIHVYFQPSNSLSVNNYSCYIYTNIWAKHGAS